MRKRTPAYTAYQRNYHQWRDTYRRLVARVKYWEKVVNGEEIPKAKNEEMRNYLISEAPTFHLEAIAALHAHLHRKRS